MEVNSQPAFLQWERRQRGLAANYVDLAPL